MNVRQSAVNALILFQVRAGLLPERERPPAPKIEAGSAGNDWLEQQDERTTKSDEEEDERNRVEQTSTEQPLERYNPTAEASTNAPLGQTLNISA